MSASDPTDAPPPSLHYILVTTTIRFLLWGGVLLDLVIYVPWMARIFRDYNMRLPKYTAWMVTFADWAAAYTDLVPVALLALLLLDVGVIGLLWRGAADICKLWSGLLTLATLIFTAWVLVCSVLPLVKLLH